MSKKIKAKTWQQERQLKFNQDFSRIIGVEPPEYECFNPEQMEDLSFQREIVSNCVAHRKRFWAAALATGIGKTVIAARIAGRYLNKGPVVYVSPSAVSIGDLEDGVINKFYRGLRLEGQEAAALGTRNDLSIAHDVSFVTPWYLAYLWRTNRRHVQKIMSKVSCLIVDEAHRFPEDRDDELVVYGRIHEIAESFRGRVVVMTGTWDRLDRQKIMGLDKPDVAIPLQKAVEMRRCAQLFGIQVIAKVVGSAKAQGELYDFHLSDRERRRYLAHVSACVDKAYKLYPRPFAVFTHRVADAEAITRRFNRLSGLGSRGMAVLTKDTSPAQRKRVITGIQRGELVGYATCAVGEEAIDIPELSVVHLVRRTKSVVRNLQAIGRAVRVRPGKKAVVVDYQTMIEGLRPHFVGISFDDLREQIGMREDVEFISGGAMVVPDAVREAAARDARLASMTMEQERALILAESRPQPPIIDLTAERERKRKEIEARVKKVVAMVKARGETIPAGWEDKVVEKLLSAAA